MIFQNLSPKILLLVLFFSVLTVGCDNTDHLRVDEDFVHLNGDHKIVKADQYDFSSEEQENNQEIAEKLAVRYINQQYPEETVIDTATVNYFYNGLVHLYNSDLEEAIIVTEEYSLMAGNPASPREILIWVDSSKTWLDDSWRAEKTETGLPEIDKLINEFNLSLKQFREYLHTSDEVVAHLKADHPFNVYAVSKLFHNLPEISKASPDAVLTGGRDIEARLNENNLLLDVTVGSGDCPSGCINKINYQFQISSNGDVKVIK